MRFCVIDKNTGICINVIELQSAEEFSTVNSNEILTPDSSGEIGWEWNGNEWQSNQNNSLTDEQLANSLRQKRDRHLKVIVDSINYMRWSSMSQEEQTAWSAYRQALLDIPQQPGFPHDITWPQPPSNGS